MKKRDACRLLLVSLLMVVWMSPAVEALVIADPTQIETLGLISFGEDGAAILRWGGRELYVTPGYLLGQGLRVVAVRHNAVVLYQEPQRQYFVLPVIVENLADKDRRPVIWCSPLDIWKVTRMVGLAYRKDWICHSETSSEVAPRRYVQNVFDLMKLVVNPGHRYYGREGIMYVAPAHVHQNMGWQLFQRRVKNFRSKQLLEHFPALKQQASMICTGKPLELVLQDISYRSGVPVYFQLPAMVPVFCTFRDRPWHEIIEHVVIFNGLWVTAIPEGLYIGLPPPE